MGLLAALPAYAADDAQTADSTSGEHADGLPEPGEGDRSFSHFGQFGLRLSLVVPYRMVFRYDESPWCNRDELEDGTPIDDRQKFCGFPGPLALDLGASFGVLGSIEPYLWGRFGFAGESETNTAPAKIVGAGVRIYTMSDSAFKVFIEPALGVEFEKGAGNPLWDGTEYKTDMVVHLGVGPQLDFSRGVGAFANAGMTVGMLRMIHASLELELGVQARFP